MHDAPPSYFEGLRDGAHAAGALYLADEVQVGYGRTGPALWRFAQSGVVPDLVTLGKPMGAGYPIGAVVTRREIVDRFAERYEYFSTFAATPAAAAAGNAVLDVLDGPAAPGAGARHRAPTSRTGCATSRRRTLLGEVRGMGLVAGIDVVDGPTARRLLEALVARGRPRRPDRPRRRRAQGAPAAGLGRDRTSTSSSTPSRGRWTTSGRADDPGRRQARRFSTVVMSSSVSLPIFSKTIFMTGSAILAAPESSITAS